MANGDTTEPDEASISITGVAAGDLYEVGVGHVGSVVEGVYGDLVMNADGTYEYQLVDERVEMLRGGQVDTDVFSYLLDDGQGETAVTTIRFSVTGAGEEDLDDEWSDEPEPADEVAGAGGPETMPDFEPEPETEPFREADPISQPGPFPPFEEPEETLPAAVEPSQPIPQAFPAAEIPVQPDPEVFSSPPPPPAPAPPPAEPAPPVVEEPEPVDDVIVSVVYEGTPYTGPGAVVETELIKNGAFGTLAIEPDGTYDYKIIGEPFGKLAPGETRIERFRYTVQNGRGELITDVFEHQVTGEEKSVFNLSTDFALPSFRTDSSQMAITELLTFSCSDLDSFTRESVDPWSITVDWGDGQISVLSQAGVDNSRSGLKDLVVLLLGRRGNISSGATTAPNQWIVNAVHNYASDATYRISVVVDDGKGCRIGASLPVKIVNVPPPQVRETAPRLQMDVSPVPPKAAAKSVGLITPEVSPVSKMVTEEKTEYRAVTESHAVRQETTGSSLRLDVDPIDFDVDGLPSTLSGGITFPGMVGGETLQIDWGDSSHSNFAIPRFDLAVAGQSLQSSDDGAIIKIRDVDESRGRIEFEVAHTYSSPGEYAVKVTVTDASGAKAHNTQVGTVDSNAVPIVGIFDILRTGTEGRLFAGFRFQEEMVEGMRTAIRIPFFAGASTPGATVLGTLRDEVGVVVGSAHSVADMAGNWTVSIPGQIHEKAPYSLTIELTAATWTGEASFPNQVVTAHFEGSVLVSTTGDTGELRDGQIVGQIILGEEAGNSIDNLPAMP